MANNRMQRYVDHLLEDLKKASQNLPKPYPYHLDHPVDKDERWIVELAKAPYKPIAEWTDISLEVFPPEHELTLKQIDQLVQAMHALYDAYCWEFDLKEEIKDPVIWYRMFMDCWDEPVQYLPQSGFDIELCAGDPSDCRMGDDCICLHDPPALEEEPPQSSESIEDNELPF